MLASLTMYTEHELHGILKVQKETVNVFVHLKIKYHKLLSTQVTNTCRTARKSTLKSN